MTQVVESLYGQDLDSGHHGSGFPLPPFRQRLLEAHLAHSAQEAKGPGQVQLRHKTDEETVYSEHKWNINNMPRCKVRLPHIFLYTDEDFHRGQALQRSVLSCCQHESTLKYQHGRMPERGLLCTLRGDLTCVSPAALCESLHLGLPNILHA